MRVFGSEEKVTEDWRKFHNEKLNDHKFHYVSSVM
jgi:hypothetical protein